MYLLEYRTHATKLKILEENLTLSPRTYFYINVKATLRSGTFSVSFQNLAKISAHAVRSSTVKAEGCLEPYQISMIEIFCTNP